MPISTAPYKREYKHSKSRGNEQMVECDTCGRRVPRYKTFTQMRGMRLNDRAVLEQVDKRMMNLMKKRIRMCPACARHRGVSKPGTSSRKKYGGGGKSFPKKNKARQSSRRKRR